MFTERRRKFKKSATVDSKTQDIGLQSLLCTVGNFNLYIFFPKLGHRQTLRLSGHDLLWNVLETKM